jgi:hypothetical protein
MEREPIESYLVAPGDSKDLSTTARVPMAEELLTPHRLLTLSIFFSRGCLGGTVKEVWRSSVSVFGSVDTRFDIGCLLGGFGLPTYACT